MSHILVVEDEEHLARGIKYNFEAEGYRVTIAGDGPSALRAIAEDAEGVDLVILDLMLPGMSGYAVCEAIRGAGNEVPIVILTARTLIEDRIRGFDVGADQYLEKPFELEELLSRTRNLLLRRTKIASAPGPKPVGDAYKFGSAEIHFDTFKVTSRGQPLRLTHMEMKLLRYFAENEGFVISRAQLLDHVWGLSSSPTTRTVDNFVMRLRKYFEENPAQPRHFLSVRGAGYRFVAEPEEG